jgi:broad specificity phosphatase PhoE
MKPAVHCTFHVCAGSLLNHPQVQVDPAVPIPLWGLNAAGRARVLAVVDSGWLLRTTQVIASAEKKAVEAAEPIAGALGVRLEVRDAMHENDRSVTGFLPPKKFEAVARGASLVAT